MSAARRDDGAGQPDVAAATGEAYRALLARLPELVRTSRLTLCGMGACVDARVSMHDMAGLMGATEPPQAVALAQALRARAASGVGGEFFADWPGGPAWLGRHVPVRYALGGTGPQAAWVLAAAGAPALMALEDRSAHMVACLDPRLHLAEHDDMVPASRLAPHGAARPDIFIFEYGAGVPIGDVIAPRASRIIVRFSNHGLEHDDAFDRLSVALAPQAGAALLSGFSNVPADALGPETARCSALARGWRTAGVATVHLELAGYDSAALGERVLDGLRGAITSIGMSHSELLTMDPGATDGAGLTAAMGALGDRLGVGRVCVHADHWAAAATLGDPAVETEALMTGCLLASSRAAAGHPVRPTGLDPAARFEVAPLPDVAAHGRWSVVCCASPYLEAPATTLGLGDTFTAGCLLVLGR